MCEARSSPRPSNLNIVCRRSRRGETNERCHRIRLHRRRPRVQSGIDQADLQVAARRRSLGKTNKVFQHQLCTISDDAHCSGISFLCIVGGAVVRNTLRLHCGSLCHRNFTLLETQMSCRALLDLLAALRVSSISVHLSCVSCRLLSELCHQRNQSSSRGKTKRKEGVLRAT